MLADAVDVEADLVGELDLLHQTAESLGRGDRLARDRVRRHLREAIEAELEGFSHCV